MEIQRTLSHTKGSISLFVKVAFDENELAAIHQYKLYRYRIKTKDGSFIGRDILPVNIQAAYRSHLARIKNRWSTALVRTTSFVLLDFLSLGFAAIGKLIKTIAKLFIGRRTRLMSLTRGFTVQSKRLEKIKEAEFFIFVSLAAIYKALEYVRNLDRSDRYLNEELFTQVEGLDFAGAGSSIEDEFEIITSAIKNFESAQ